MDPNLKNFAVFLNSSSSVNKTTEKSSVQIPFTGNLAASDPNKALQVVLSQFRFTNSMYNINERNCTLRIACQFAPGRGYSVLQSARLWETWTIKIPLGTYNIEQMCTFLSLAGPLYPEEQPPALSRVGYESISQQFRYPAVAANFGGSACPAHPSVQTFANCFVGFGAIPADSTDNIVTPGVVTAENGQKTIFRSPDLGHLIQYGTDITTPCLNILADGAPGTNSSLDFSMIYKAIYILFDEDTVGLLKVMGYFNIDRLPAPLIQDYHANSGLAVPTQRGYGIGLQAQTAYTQFPVFDFFTGQFAINQPPFDAATMRFASDNTTFYNVVALDGVERDIVEKPVRTIPISFNGYFFGTALNSTSVEMYVLFEGNTAGTDYLVIEPGLFISGTGVGVPNPYVTNRIGRSGILANTYIAVIPPDPLLTSALWISQANWDLNNGYGLTTGSPLTLDAYDLNGQGATFAQVVAAGLLGYYVQSILQGEYGPDSTTLGVQLVLNAEIPVPFQTGDERAYMTSLYTVSSAQTISSISPTIDYTLWVASVVSLNDRTGRLVPNLLTNLEGVGEIHVHCAQLRTQYFSSVNFQPLAPSDVIAVVPVDSAFGSAQTYQPPVTLVAYLTNVNIVTLNIQLTTAAGELLDFNGLDWSMVLKCEEVEIASTVEQNTSGTLNTIFQDQLTAMEGTAQSQIRMQRHKGKRMLPYQFFDGNEGHRRKNNTFDSSM
jgi:hypothetical protein